VAPKEGLDVVSMKYFKPKDYTNVSAKIIFTVGNPAAFAQAIGNEKFEVIQQPGNGICSIAGDANGCEIEIAF
jgi:hypothetical protein